MIGTLKSALKRNPALYRVLQKTYYKSWKILEAILGTKLQEWSWKFRHLYSRDWAENYIAAASLNNAHRKLLVDEVQKFVPFQTALEIGCASGPNLYLLAKKFPQTKFYGIDISRKAVEKGERWLGKEGVKSVELCTGRADKLSHYGDKSFDIVFTDAVLMYIGPDKIDRVISEIFRIAKRAVLFIEWHEEIDEARHYDTHWIYNYKKLLAGIPAARLEFKKIPADVWGGDWSRYGYIIEAEL